MLSDYKDLRLDLGSIQYLGAAKIYDELHDQEILLNSYLLDVIQDPTKFKKEMKDFFTANYKMYTALVNTKSYKDADPELLEDTNCWDEEVYNDILDYISDSMFRFPVGPRLDTEDLVKLALTEWFIFAKNRAWDLWTATSYINQFLDSTGSAEIDYSENENIGKFLYTLKRVYNFSDKEIQKLAGDFDT